MAGSSTVTITIGRSVLWTPYKELYSTVESAIVKKEPDAIPELESLLRTHKPNFVSLLSNPAKSSVSKGIILKAPTEGIPISGQTTVQIPQTIVDEAIVISEMFDLNELTALELLIAGQHQQPLFPGLTRGLVSVLLYYDGRRSLINTLRVLTQAREGRTWTLGLSTELLYMVTRYTDQLKEDNIIQKIFDLLEKINPVQEMDMLQRNRALGNPRYRKQVSDMIDEIRQSLAEVIFCWACQSTLSLPEIKRLIDHLAKYGTMKGDGTLDSVTVTLIMSLLYSMDVSVLHTAEEMDEQVTKCPLISQPQEIKIIHKEILATRSWEVPGILSVIQFAWAITLRTLSQYSWALQSTDLNEYLELDEKILDSALQQNCFLSLNNLIIHSKVFENEEFFVKRVHALITDLITLMPLKIKELRNQGDESARIAMAHLHEGIQPPSNLNRTFEQLMGVISNLYKKDNFKLELSFDYWCPSETFNDPSFLMRPPQRQISLYKFLRLAGDLLPAPLFVPYVNMLTTLSKSRQCAHQCFIMLRMNDKASGSQSSIISWDHFFESLHQYYNTLRQETPITTDNQHIYRQRLSTRGISPQEVEGLCSISKLMATVIEHDEMARLALWENPQYVPGYLLIGLIGCSVPPEVKASLLNLLSAFAQTSDIAIGIWQQIEISQIIPTIKASSIYQPSGIQMDLIEVETRMEEYPITRAALSLINSLIKHPLPQTLGAGQRKPGFEPYLNYVKDTVFLQSQFRAYKNEGEKWQVTLACMEIMLKLLKDYQILASDFTGHNVQLPDGTWASSHQGSGIQSPGYLLMVQLLQYSDLLKLTLLLMDEGTTIFDNYTPPTWQDSVEKCTLLSLEMIYEVLVKQDEFLTYVRNSGSSLLVTSMDRLLLTVNPRSGHPDQMVVIAKYIQYNIFLPKHALQAVMNLENLCKISQIAQQLVLAFTTEATICEALLHGFVECLDNEEIEAVTDPSDNINTTHNDIRQHIIQLLLNCLNHPAPNLSHLLLGFQTRRPVSKTVLQDPGVLNSPRTCLHSVLAILDRGCDTRGFPIAAEEMPRLAEMCYHLLHVLCANKETTSPTLRYLRTSRDFIYRHIQYLPLSPKSGANKTIIFGQQSWILRMLALELRILVVHQQRSHVQRLLKLLLEDTVEHRDYQTENDTTLDSTIRSSLISQAPNIGGIVRRKLLQMLDEMNFTQNWPTPPNFEYLDIGKVEKALMQCESEDRSGRKIVNVYEFHQKLVEDLPAFQGLPALSNRPPFATEIRHALQYALQRNSAHEAIQSKHQAFEAWKQVSEVIFSACPLELLSSGQTHQIILEICQELLMKIVKDDTLPALTAPASGVILILISNLHNNVLSIKEPQTVLASSSSSLAMVLKGVIECLLKTGIGVQRVRVNYYGTLLNLLRMVQKLSEARSSMDLSILDRESEIEKLTKEYMSVILGFGDSLIDIACRDACGGHDVTKMSALALLDTVISLDRTKHWLSFIESKGYMGHIISSLTKDDENLQVMLSKGLDSLNTLFVFESKLSLLIRIAANMNGAQALIRCGLITKLCECNSIDMRPEKDYSLDQYNVTGEFVQHHIKCFQQILKPVFQLLLAVTTILGDHHLEAATQLMYFITAHSEVFNLILRDHSTMINLIGAEELSLATSILARMTKNMPNDAPALESAMIEKHGQIGLLHSRAVSLIQPLTTIALTQNRQNSANSQKDMTLKITLLQTIANILSSCRFDVSRSFTSRGNYLGKVVFAPTLVDNKSSQDLFLAARAAGGQQRSFTPPNLAILVSLLNNCSVQFTTAVAAKKKIESSLQIINTLSAAELSDWLPDENKLEFANQHTRELAQLNMTKLVSIRNKEYNLYSFIIESTLLLLWRHLEYFLKFCVPDESNIGDSSSPNRSLNKTRVKVVKGDLEMLRADVKSIINDQLFSKIHSVQDYMRKEKVNVDFAEALLRRLKRLVKF